MGILVRGFEGMLTRAIDQELLLPQTINTNNFGIVVNDSLKYLNRAISSWWLFSSCDSIQTFLYNFNDKIYLDIVLTYPWTYRDPEPSEQYYSYDEFIKNYKPYIVQEIPVNVARQWQQQCKELLKSIDYDF